MANNSHILIVEDDEAIATGLALNLKLAGFSALVASDGEQALEMAAAAGLSLILLDIGLPKKNGLEVLSDLRSAGNRVPVIVLSARDNEFDKVGALRLGADDYVTKPFALAELLARIDAVLRRAHPPETVEPAESVCGFGDVVIDLNTREVRRHENHIKLTHLEFELMSFLLQNPRRVFSRAELLRQVWGANSGNRRTVDNFLGQLRAKLEADAESPKHFITVRGSGYRFDP